MNRPGGAGRGPAVLAAALLLAGCGVRPQDGPEPVVTAGPVSTPVEATPHPSGPQLIVYFVRGADLAPVPRPADTLTAASAVELLVAGPTGAEVAAGVRTALSPEVVDVEQEAGGGPTTVSVTRGFAGISGGNQLLAVAQIVWTLTGVPSVDTVRFRVDGAPLEVPTDDGLTDQPVGRDDYRSVSPAAPAPPSGSDVTGPTPSTAPR